MAAYLLGLKPHSIYKTMKVYNRLFIVLFLVLMTNGVKGQTTPEELKYAFLSGDISADTLIVQNIDSFLNCSL